MKVILWNIGWLVLGLTWLGPLPWWAEQSFAAHMTLHMSIVAVVSPLLAIAISGGQLDPVRRWPSWFVAIPASVVELLIVWAWHAPQLHHWARNSHSGFVAEQGSFLLIGLWLWLSAFGGELPRNAGRAGAGVIGLLLTSMHMTFLGALLTMSPRLLYAHHSAFGPYEPLLDQHLGGSIMLVVGGIVYLSGGVWLTADVLRNRTLRGAYETNIDALEPSGGSCADSRSNRRGFGNHAGEGEQRSLGHNTLVSRFRQRPQH